MGKIEMNTNMASRNSFLMAASVLKGVFWKVQGYHCTVAKLFPRVPRDGSSYGGLYGFPTGPAPRQLSLHNCKIFSP
jgi:hypothetical protein